MSVFYIGLAAVVTSCVLFPVRQTLARSGVIDRPNARSSHTAPTVRGGGVVIIAAVVALLSVFAFQFPALWALIAGILVLGAVSFVDDIRGVGALQRMVVHVVSAIAGFLGVLQAVPLSSVTLLLVIVSLFWVVGYTNAFNFMDGINGIAGVQVAVTAVGTALLAFRLGVEMSHPIIVICLFTGGAALGFLPHNFPRARVFMGDVGSAPLGYLLSLLAVWLSFECSPWVLFWVALLHANFVLDTTITVLRRVSTGAKLYEAHRDHFYQRLVRGGRSHTFVTLTHLVLQGFVVGALWWSTRASSNTRIAVAASVITLWLGFFAYAEWVFRRSSAVKA